MATLSRRLRQAFVGAFLTDRTAGPEDVVFISGSGRSGTTWVAEVVNHRGDRRYLFEPLHPEEVRASRGFGAARYLRPGADGGAAGRLLERIVAGRFRSVWADRFNTRLRYRKRLVKEIHANLLLPWLARRFPGLKIVWILRHPLAVAASQGRMEEGFPANPEALLADEKLMADHLEPFREVLATAEAPAERRAAIWCAQQLVPLRGLAPADAHVLFYEHLVTRPDRELTRLSEYLGEPFGEEARAAVGKPSALSVPSSAVVRGTDPLRARLDAIAPADRDAVLGVVERFGLSRLYGPDPLPATEPEDVLRPAAMEAS